MSFGRPDDGLRYGSYLKVPELLSLQAPLTDEHDELQFIVVHQVYELWFRLILHELDTVLVLLEESSDASIGEAVRLLQRVARIQDVLVAQLAVIETMRPGDFLRFRDRLKPASGFQSAQFRELECLLGERDPALYDRCDAEPAAKERLRRRFEAKTLRDLFATIATKRGFAMSVAEPGSPPFDESVAALLPLYASPERDPVLYSLAEALLDFDERLGIWRTRHYWMVERTIGGRIGTGHAATGEGFEGVRYLVRTLHKKGFLELWEVRTRLGGEA